MLIKFSAEAARQRSVSTPVPPPTNVVAYSAAAENVNLPDLSIAERNSVLANEAKMKRSFSDASKGEKSFLLIYTADHCNLDVWTLALLTRDTRKGIKRV